MLSAAVEMRSILYSSRLLSPPLHPLTHTESRPSVTSLSWDAILPSDNRSVIACNLYPRPAAIPSSGFSRRFTERKLTSFPLLASSTILPSTLNTILMEGYNRSVFNFKFRFQMQIYLIESNEKEYLKLFHLEFRNILKFRDEFKFSKIFSEFKKMNI